MKIFKVKRITTLKNDRFKKYFIYSIGEIILVVIGIFIGLQVNKLNDKSIKQKKIDNYYSRINEEVTFAIKLIESNNKYSDSLVKGLVYNLNTIDKNKIDSLYIKNFTFLTDNEQQTFFFPVIDEFLEQGYLTSIDDLSLREQFQILEYYRKQSDIDDSNVKSLYYNIVLPELIDKLNFLDIDFMNYDDVRLGFSKLKYNNDLENNYEALSVDHSIRNLLVYRMNIEKNRIINNKSLENILKKIQEKTTANTSNRYKSGKKR